MLADLQRDLAAWLLDDSDLPEELAGLGRLALYRNNVQGSLVEVLAAAFPTVRTVVGIPFFEATSRRFIAAYPPLRAELWSWGGEFPAFLADFPPARSLPYLGDLARLEWMMGEAYFASDADILSLHELAGLSANALPDLCFLAHPSARLIRSSYAIHSIWDHHRREIDVTGLRIHHPEAVLILRRDGDVYQRSLLPWQATFITVLLDGKSLADAADAVPPTELQAEFARLITDGLFTGYALAPAPMGVP